MRPSPLPKTLTVLEVAGRFGVSKNKVLSWIAKKELAAINTATTPAGKKIYRIAPDALAAFELGRSSAPEKCHAIRKRAVKLPPGAVNKY